MPILNPHSSKRNMNSIISHTSNTLVGMENSIDTNLQIIIHLRLFYI